MTRLGTYRDELRAALKARLQPVSGGIWDGVQALTDRDITECFDLTGFPPVDEHVAELATPATVYLAARCHVCGESATVTVDLESKTTVDDKRRTLAAKVDAGSVVHVCGQMALPLRNLTPTGQAEAWDITDLTGPTAPALDAVALAELLGRVGVPAEPELVDGWTAEERIAAQQWAVRFHIARTEGAEAPPTPEHVPEPRDEADPTPGDAPPEDAPPPSGKWLGGIDTTPDGPLDKPRRGRRPKPLDIKGGRSPEQMAEAGDLVDDDEGLLPE